MPTKLPDRVSAEELQQITYAQTSEAAFECQLRQFAESLGWLYYHTHNSRRSNAGFPDCVMVRGKRVIYAELKTEKGKVRPEQVTWLKSLKRAGQEVYLWRPSNWPEIERILGREVA